MSRVYVASSWRNSLQPRIVSLVLGAGHEVYDFRHPAEGDNGFAWRKIDPDWETWTPHKFRRMLEDPIAVAGFGKDLDAMTWADTFVLVQPCGRSAHLELGWAIGQGKRTAFLLDGGEPELMYKLADRILISLDELEAWLGSGLP